jgi:hypothetical protein
MYMIHKHLYEIHKHADYKQLLQAIVTILLRRAKADNHTTFINLKSHIGIQGNDLADWLAGEATVRSICDQQVIFSGQQWPKEHVLAYKGRPATHDRPAVSWQLGNLSHDVNKGDFTLDEKLARPRPSKKLKVAL